MMSRENWWIDLLENELPAELGRDVAKIFAKSPLDSESLAGLMRLRRWLKGADPADLLWDDEKAKDLTVNILKRLAGAPQIPGAQPRLRSIPTDRQSAKSGGS